MNKKQDELTKKMVHDRITEELIASPELLGKFLDQYGAMGIWFCFQQIETNRRNHDELEKKFYSLRRDHEDLLKKVSAMETKIKSHGKRMQELSQSKIV